MSILVRFNPEGLTSEMHSEVRRRLDEAGVWPPDGLEYHVCFGDEGQLKVSEIWSSNEQLEAFGQHLMPILREVGVRLSGPPEHLAIHQQDRY